MRVAHHYIKKENREKSPIHQSPIQKNNHLLQKGKRPHTQTTVVPMAWSMERPLAPAIVHSKASSLAISRTAGTLDATPLNTQLS
jgi:hypothetical protein